MLTLDNNEIFELADRLKVFKDKKSSLEAEIKAVNKEIEQVEVRMIELMTEDELQSFKRASNLFYLMVSEYPSAVPERKDELYRALKAKGYDYLFTINARTLAASIKEMTEQNDGILPAWLEGLIQVYEKTSIGIRRA
jgi:predicted nuclease with TOPRIM domain